MSKRLRLCTLAFAVLTLCICLGSSAHATTYTQFECAIHTAHLDVTGNSITLECVAPSNNIPFYAFNVSSNPAMGQMIMNALVRALADCNDHNACNVIVYYDTNSADNPPGCGTSNCRAMNAIDVF